MSASREKKKRQELQGSSVSKHTEPVAKKTPGWKIAVGWLIGIAFVVCFVVVLLLNSSFFAKHSTAATVGEHKVSPAMVSTYYNSGFNNFYSSYGNYISYFFDPNLPLREQIYDESTGQTWDDYFMSTAKDSLTWAYTMYDQAKAAGTTLDEDDMKSIDDNIASFKQIATENGFASTDGYLAAAFGKGVDSKLYREFMEVQLLASKFYSEKLESYDFSDEEKLTYYADHTEMYDTVTAEYAQISAKAPATISTDEDGKETTVEPTEEENAAALLAARDEAQAILDGGVDALAEAEDLRDLKDYQKPSISYVLPEETADWLFDTARVAGDMKIFENESNVFVVHFVSRDNHDYLTRNIRMVQINAETAENVLGEDGQTDAEATKEAQDAFNETAAQETKKLFETWQDGEATEETFIEMAKANSDAPTKDDGGLTENVSKSDLTDEIIEWLYDAVRTEGDCKYFTEAGSTCYIVYYLGEGDNGQMVMVEDDLLTDTYNTWYAEVSNAYPVEEQSFGMRFVTTR